jgi:hypothetical protein
LCSRFLEKRGGLRKGRPIAATNGDGSAEPGKALSDGAADAAAPSGDQRHGSGERLLPGIFIICSAY